MERAFGIKSKLGFVRGDFPRPTDPYQLVRWERCDSVVLTWIVNSVSPEIAETLTHSKSSMEAWFVLQIRFSGSNGPRLYALHREITNFCQGELLVSEYHGKLTNLWGDEESLNEDNLCSLGLNCKSTRSMEIRKLRSRIMQFLLGLNEIHSQVQTQILSTKPLPTIDEAYALILEDEIQKGIIRINVEASALYANQEHTNPKHQPPKGSQGNQNGKGKRNMQ